MENRSQGKQLSSLFLACAAALLRAPFADAFHPQFRAGRGIEHHQRCINCPPDEPQNLGGLLPMHDGKYPQIGKSAHYHSPGQPHFYENQPHYNIQPNYADQQPLYNAPPVRYDGPPPPYNAPPQYNALPPPPPPPPPFNVPPPHYNSLLPPPPPPPYNHPPQSREAPLPHSIYISPPFDSPYEPLHQVVYESPPQFELTPIYDHVQQRSSSYEQQPDQDNSQPMIQLVYEIPEQKNSSSSSSTLIPLDTALKSESNETSTISPTRSTDSPNISDNPSSDDSEAPTLDTSNFSSTSSPEVVFQEQIQDEIPNEHPNILLDDVPIYTVYHPISQPPRSYQATMAYEQSPPWSEFRPNYSADRGSSYGHDRPPSPVIFNRVPRKFECELVPEYRARSFYEPDEGGSDEDYGKTLHRRFHDFEEEERGTPFGRFDRRTFEEEPARIDPHYHQYPGDENPYKSYRPYKRHDNYLQQRESLERKNQREQYQRYMDAVRVQPSMAGVDITDDQLESMVRQALEELRQQEAEDVAWSSGYDSPYSTERPAFVTMHQPKRLHQLEGSASPSEARETTERPRADSTTGRGELQLAEDAAALEAVANEQPARVDLLEELEQPPPTVTEPTIVDLLQGTTGKAR